MKGIRVISMCIIVLCQLVPLVTFCLNMRILIIREISAKNMGNLFEFSLFSRRFYTPLKPFNGPYITHVPEIRVHELTKKDKYVVIGSDGLWDDLNEKEVS